MGCCWLTDVKGANKGNVTKTAKLLRLFRLAKLLRLARLRRIIKKYAEEFEGLMTAVKLIALLVCMLVLSHVLCCLWYGVGNFSDCGWVAHNYPCAAGTVVDCGSGVLDLDAPVRCCSVQSCTIFRQARSCTGNPFLLIILVFAAAQCVGRGLVPGRAGSEVRVPGGVDCAGRCVRAQASPKLSSAGVELIRIPDPRQKTTQAPIRACTQ
jgi:hypothetical protein